MVFVVHAHNLLDGKTLLPHVIDLHFPAPALLAIVELTNEPGALEFLLLGGGDGGDLR